MRKVLLRQKRLSFLIACLAAVVVFVGFQFVRTDGQGTAQAFSGVSASVPQDGVSYSSKNRGLRAAISDNPASILDLKGSEVRSLFLEPELVRAELPTVIWQYRNDVCVMDVYYTASSKDASNSPVVHYEIRDRNHRDGQKLEAAECARGLLAPKPHLVSLIKANAFYKSPAEQ